MEIEVERILASMEKYLNIPSPTGYTREAINSIEDEIKNLGFKTSRTNKDALIVEVDGEDNSKARLITAHIDTLGAMVKYIEPNGKIRYNKVGGGAWSAVEGENCTVFSRNNKKFRGTIMPDMAATHIYGQALGNQERNQKNMYLRLDEKISSREDVENLGIGVGDYIAMDTRYENTETGFIKSRYLDNKLAVAIVLELMRMIKSKKLRAKNKLYFYISNYEESGHGVSYIPEDTYEMIAIDIGIVGDRQNSDEYSVSIAAKDNKTPYNFEFRNRLVDICEENNVDYKVDLYNFYSTDASQCMHQGKDVNFAALGPGINSSHHYERTHIDSIINTTRLLAEYIRSV